MPLSTLDSSYDLSLTQRLIIALDVSNAAEAQDLVARIGESGSFYKVGLQLFSKEGPAIVRDLSQAGKRVFLDLKFHDIPNTVAGAVRSASELGIYMLTVHASGGSKMLRAATEAARGAHNGPKVIAVTVLTSSGPAEIAESGQTATAEAQVARLTELAKNAACDGVVASPWEASLIRRSVGSNMLIVTPGIRPAGSKADDQNRTATAADAIRAGASHLVIGRPITSAPDPASASKTFLDEISRSLK